MEFKEFLEAVQKKDNEWLQHNLSICFRMPDKISIPIAFATQFFHVLKKKGYAVESIDSSTVTVTECIALLQTCFLGMSKVYWIRNFEQAEKKYQRLLWSVLAEYKGPHQLIIFLPTSECTGLSQQFLKVDIPAAVTMPMLLALGMLMTGKDTVIIQRFAQKIFSLVDHLLLDQACMALSYVPVMGKYNEQASFFTHIIPPEKSLFMLSQHFFAKETSSFYSLWYQFETEYPLTFWSTFWSEHLWRAYHTRYFIENNQLQQARIAAARLPFSFLQKHWKKSSLAELKNAHQFIYELDREAKNSNETPAGLELFYSKFFLGQF